MIKSSSIRRICIATLVLFILFIIYLFPKKEKLEETIYYSEKELIPIYLIDNNNYVSRTTIIKNTNNLEDTIKYIISTLTINSNESSYIQDGFNAIIPEGTQVLDISLNDNTLKINFSKELLNISEKMEEKMIETIIYSLTEIDVIKNIELYVNGNKLTNLPKSNKVLPNYLNKEYGINKEYNISSIKDSTKTTIYYLSKIKDYYYYVPITKITNDNKNHIEIIIQELKTTPINQTNLISYLKASSNISSYELLESSISLSFDNYLISNLDNKDILESVKYSIALSLRDTYNIDTVTLNILDDSEVLNLYYSFSD